MSPVMMRSAVFGIICSLFSRVSEMIGDHMVDEYSIMLRVYVFFYMCGGGFLFVVPMRCL